MSISLIIEGRRTKLCCCCEPRKLKTSDVALDREQQHRVNSRELVEKKVKQIRAKG